MLGRIVLSHHQPVPTLPQGIGLAQTSSAFFFLVPGVCGLGNRYKTLTIPAVGSDIYIQAMPWTIRGWSLQESNWKMTGPWLITRPEVVAWNVVSKCWVLCCLDINFSCRWRMKPWRKTGTWPHFVELEDAQCRARTFSSFTRTNGKFVC